jgi:hypothetical protein
LKKLLNFIKKTESKPIAGFILDTALFLGAMVLLLEYYLRSSSEVTQFIYAQF